MFMIYPFDMYVHDNFVGNNLVPNGSLYVFNYHESSTIWLNLAQFMANYHDYHESSTIWLNLIQFGHSTISNCLFLRLFFLSGSLTSNVQGADSRLRMRSTSSSRQ